MAFMNNICAVFPPRRKRKGEKHWTRCMKKGLKEKWKCASVILTFGG